MLLLYSLMSNNSSNSQDAGELLANLSFAYTGRAGEKKTPHGSVRVSRSPLRFILIAASPGIDG
ncbi:MAG: hypothetical protein R3B54_00260 [Bdellovibrionota bacterium]